MSIKALVTSSKEKLKKQNVAKKISGIFQNVVVRVMIVIAFLVVANAISLMGISKLYNKSLKADNIQGEIRIDIQALSKHFLWALATNDSDTRQTELEKISNSFAEFDEYEEELGRVYDNSTMISQFYSDLETVETNAKTLEEMFTDGKTSDEIYEYFNNTLYPSIDEVASDLKTVSSEIEADSHSLYATLIGVNIVAIIIAIFLIVTTILYIVNASKNLSDSVTEPISIVSKAAEDMAKGKLNISVDYEAEDELGRFAKDIEKSTGTISDVVNDISVTLNRMSTGDFSEGSRHPEIYIGDYKEISTALDEIAGKLSEALSQVRESSTQVAQGANNMSQGATALAEGATDQAAAIEELTASVTTVTEQTRSVADAANQSNDMAQKVKEDVDTSARKMHLVTDAMTRITEASKEIELVTNSIEAIAKKTQLLALNASIEAARAGDAGKGFAVVAGQISQLANQSSEAAKSTHQLISDTMDEIANGNAVVEETKLALEKVVDSVNDVSEMMMQSGNMANDQVSSMEQITEGIGQISNVVQSNSATAQESSAVSQELSDESSSLNELIDRFIVKEN